MSPRDVVVSFVIPACTLPVRVLRSKRWLACDEHARSWHVLGAVDLEERPKVNPIQKRAGKKRRKA